MATNDREVGDLTAAGTLDGTQKVHVVKDGNSRQSTAQDIADLAGASGLQPLDVDLTAIAGLTPTNDDIIQRKGGAWVNRTLTQLVTDLVAPLASAKVAFLNTAAQVITGGARVTAKDLGTITTGTVTPDPGDRPHQKYVNGGAHTLAPGTNQGSYWLDITNNSSAGAITTSGWTKVVGSSFTTTNADKFACVAHISDIGSLLSVQAMQ
jgi:hypothetical protein